MRDFIHVEDLCSAHILALEALEKGHASDVYNVGTGTGVSVREVIEAVCQASGTDFSVRNAQRRAGDPAVLVSNPSKLMREFGWTPKYSDIRTIVESALRWHTTHKQGYADRH